MTKTQEDEIRRGLGFCGCGGLECNGWNCKTVRLLLDEIDRLRRNPADQKENQFLLMNDSLVKWAKEMENE